MEKYLEGKKILFIAPSFFGYEKEIKKEMENNGAKVKYYADNPYNDILNSKILVKFSKFRNKIYKNYFSKILLESKKEEYDYCFVIKGDMIPNFFLHKLKINKKTFFIMYQWDTIKRFPQIKDKLSYFDKIYSFEYEDTQIYPKIKYLPLFYLEKYSEIKNLNLDKEIDLLFIGSNHSDRMEILNKIKKISEELDLKCFFHIQNKIYAYIKNIIFNKNFNNFKELGYTYKSLTVEEIIELYKKSKIIIDIQALGQKGLTMRMIECLGAQKKIITTNENISNKDFYDEKNILIIDRENININMEFIKKEYEPIDETLYKKYSLDAWIKTLFEE